MALRSSKPLVIAISGTFPGYKQADLKTLILNQGACFSNSVTVECTHLVTNGKDVEKNSTKYQAACNSDKCQIVSLDWLLESVKANKPLSEKAYVLGQSQPAQGDTKNGNAETMKQEPEENNGATKSKKRGIKKENDQEEEPNKKQKDSQRAGFKSLNVPIDEAALRHFNEHAPHLKPEVLIDDAGVIWDATLNQTVATNNANKFYRIQVAVTRYGKTITYWTWNRWGRVGERGQSSMLEAQTLDEAIRVFTKKFREKSGLKWEDRLNEPKKGKYTFIEINYEDDEEPKDKKEKIKKEPGEEKPPVESQLSKPLQDLMSFIFNQNHFLNAMREMDYDAEKLPLGKLSERTLKAGFSILKELSELIADPQLAMSRYNSAFHSAAEILSNQYFTTIPHVFGRNRPPVLSTGHQIKKEVDLLEALTDMDVANEIMNEALDVDEVNQLDQQFKGLGMKEMTPLDHQSEEFRELSDYLKNSSGSTHHINYKVIDIFRIERNGEEDRFNTSPFGGLDQDRRLLWHGSRSTNFGGILSQGLRIAPPEAPVNGYMFGKGVYLADTSTKSANYCCSHSSGNMGLLLLCDAELGDPMHKLYDSDYNAGDNAKKAGSITTLGQGRSIPGGWKDAGSFNQTLKGVTFPDVSCERAEDAKAGLMYNEYIVYDVAQIRQRYLFYVKM
ncbi:hypothetical protein N7450_007378 [Penicillium hetheringtonii]|uniref:Poly [ADP-ribose] polymerase n=1 Tax=Penicillium hetheringtonii TaxID=911720 RepID=A0AAD6DHI8_9EURO|nr:hypothetical protein N7450_007378 [Penicillium hetheringtonii]